MANHETPESQPGLFDPPAAPESSYPAHEPPETRLSEAYYDLGGHPHQLTLAEARALEPQGLGGKEGARLVARAKDIDFYNRNLHHPDDDPSRTPVLAAQHKPLQAELTLAALDIARQRAGGDPRGQEIILAAHHQRRLSAAKRTSSS